VVQPVVIDTDILIDFSLDIDDTVKTMAIILQHARQLYNKINQQEYFFAIFDIKAGTLSIKTSRQAHYRP